MGCVSSIRIFHMYSVTLILFSWNGEMVAADEKKWPDRGAIPMPPTDDLDAGLGLAGGDDNDIAITGHQVDDPSLQTVTIPEIAMGATGQEQPPEGEVDLNVLGPQIHAQLAAHNL